MAHDTKNDSSGPRLYCETWNGSKTPGFRKFVRDFKTGADATFLQDDDCSVWQACIDTDQGGGDPNAEAMPGSTQAGYTNAVRRRKRRQNTAFRAVYHHIENERLREMLDALPSNDRRGVAAWALIKSQRLCAIFRTRSRSSPRGLCIPSGWCTNL